MLRMMPATGRPQMTPPATGRPGITATEASTTPTIGPTPSTPAVGRPGMTIAMMGRLILPTLVARRPEMAIAITREQRKGL